MGMKSEQAEIKRLRREAQKLEATPGIWLEALICEKLGVSCSGFYD